MTVRHMVWRWSAPFLAGMLVFGMAWGMTACAPNPLLKNARVVVPSCMSEPAKPTPLPNEQVGFGGPFMTDQVPAALGFSPWLATYLPADLTWDGMVVNGPRPAGVALPHGIVAPLFHATYRLVSPPAEFGPHAVSALALDETTTPGYGVTSLLVGTSAFRVESQSPIQIGAAPAVLYHLAAPTQDQAPGVTIIALVWHEGSVTLQLTAVQGGAYQLQFSPAASVNRAVPTSGPAGIPTSVPPLAPRLTVMTTWAAAGDAALLAIARSVMLYNGCGAGK